MIKIYTHHEFLIPEKEHLFFPLLAEMTLVDISVVHNKFCFVESVDECDVLILPLSINHFLETGKNDIVDFFKKQSKENNKILWVYSSGDLGLTLKEDRIYVFRLADFKSRASKWTIIMPVFINDPYGSIYQEKIAFLPKTAKPIIGYVGHAKGGFIKLATAVLVFLKENFDIFRKKIVSDYCRFYLSSHVRLKYLKLIQDCEAIESQFIFRDKYRAGVKTKEDRIKTTLDFFDNIKNSHYVFCMRGGGNFSVRFYETLAMGRIPLFIDTDCILPLNALIDWNNYCVIVNDDEISTMNQKLLHFHSSQDDKQFVALQKNNRILWEDYLTRANYFSHIHDLFIAGKL